MGSPGERWGTPEVATPPSRPQPSSMAPLGMYTPTNMYTRNQLLAVFRELKARRLLGLPPGMHSPKYGLNAQVSRASPSLSGLQPADRDLCT